MNGNLIFRNREVAQKVVELLPAYGARETEEFDLSEIVIAVDTIDMRAIETAVVLSCMELHLESLEHRPFVMGLTPPSCRLPMPSDREYCGGNPRIYAACLSAYNNGFHHGMWVDALQPPEKIKEDIDWMLSYSPAHSLGDACEEWGIHTYEGFLGVSLSEYESLECVSKLAHVIDEVADFRAYEVWSSFADDPTDVEAFQNSFVGVYRSPGAYVEEVWTSLGLIPKLETLMCPLTDSPVSAFIDFEGIAHDLDLAGRIDFRRIGAEEFCVFFNY